MEILSLEKLIEHWNNDSKFVKSDIESETLRIPNLHAKFGEQYARHSTALKRKEIELSQLVRLKKHYYSGNMNNKEELAAMGWQPFQLILNNREIEEYLKADPQIADLKLQYAEHETAIEYLKFVMQQIKDRTWQVQNYITYEKYSRGV